MGQQIFKLLLLLCSITVSFAHYRPQSFGNLRFYQDESPNVQPRSVNRLLNNTEPLHYRLDLTTNIHNRETVFNGIVQIRFRTLEALSSIRVNAYRLTIQSCYLFTGNEEYIPGTLCTTVDRFLDVTAPTTLAANQEFILQVVYEGQHRTPSEGFHSSYYNVNGQTRYLASTQFQSVFAREAFPCFDEPYYRVPISLRINHDPSYNALSNAEVEAISSGVTVFKETWQLPSYLIAFVVSDFQCTAKTGKQRICAPPNRMDEVGLAVEASDKILAWMEQTFDEPYEHEKLDHIAIPTFQFGGMENWGLIVYHPSFLLFKDGVNTINDKINVASVIAHELAHMFYGNLITPRWWTYLWLSEGLATLYENYATHAVYPELRLNELFINDVLQPVLRVDASGTRPMTFYVDSVGAIEGIFDSISYSKAGSIFRMIKYAITEATFHKAMQKYLNENRNTGVDEKPIYRALEAAIVEDQTAPPGIIESAMDSWSLQGGYPLITVERDYSSNRIHVTQAPFLVTTDPGNRLWTVPITFTKKTGANFLRTQANFWLSAKEQDVANDAVASDWVIFNLHQAGYYRVNYDTRNWEQLIAELTIGDHEVFPPTNRGQMIDDINVLANNGRVENRLRLSLMEYLSRETDMIPLQSARIHLRALIRMFAYSNKFHLLQKYANRMLEKTFENAEKFFFADEDVNTMKSRSVLIDLACSAGMEKCQALTRTLTFAELRTQTELINGEDREMVQCHGLRSASPRMFQLFLKTFDELYREVPAETEGPEEEEEDSVDYHDYRNINRMTRLVGCYGDQEGINEILKTILTTEFQYPRYRYPILRSIISNGHVDHVLAMLVENIERFEDLNLDPLEQAAFSSVVLAISREIMTEEQEEKFNVFLKVLAEGEFPVSDQVQVNIQNNRDWIEKHGEDLESWLVENYNDEPVGSAVSISLSIGGVLLAICASVFL